MSVAALVLAGGRGERLGHSLPKAFVPVAGAPLLVHALEALAAVSEIEWLIPVVPEDQLQRLNALALEERPVLAWREIDRACEELQICQTEPSLAWWNPLRLASHLPVGAG